MELDREHPRVERGKGIYVYTEDGTEIIEGARPP